jgi:FAD:protein FMN transferase
MYLTDNRVWDTFLAIGTEITIQIIVDNKELIDYACNDLLYVKNLFLEKQHILSRFEKGSDICRLNSNLHAFIDVSSDTYNLLKKSLLYFKKSDGLFDPRIEAALEDIGYKLDYKKNNFEDNDTLLIQSYDNYFSDSIEDDILFGNNSICIHKKIDLSGIAKGYINDLAVNYLLKNNWKNFYIDAGGDLYAAGTDENTDFWYILLDSSPQMYIPISNQAIATSGIQFRSWNNNNHSFHHLINPKDISNYDTNFLSVSIVNDTTESADVWAKVLFLMGEKAKEYSLINNLDVYILHKNGVLWKSKT